MITKKHMTFIAAVTLMIGLLMPFSYGQQAPKAARRSLASMNLEDILTNRNRLSEDILTDVKEAASSYGVSILRADVKDLIAFLKALSNGTDRGWQNQQPRGK